MKKGVIALVAALGALGAWADKAPPPAKLAAKNGLWCFKLEKVDGNDVVTGTLTRTVEVRGADALIIQIR